MLNIFSCVCYISVCLLWRNACLGFLPTFWLGCFVFLVLSCMSCLYILEINSFVCCFICYYCLPFWGLSVHLVYSFCCAEAFKFNSVQFSSVAQLCPTLCDPMNRSTPGLPVHHQLLEFTQTHVHRVGDAIQLFRLLSPSSPPAPSPSQHQSLFQWVNSSHEVAKVLEFQLRHQSLQWTPGTDLL